MKHSWKLCVIFGSLFVVVVIGALILLNQIMASADEEKSEFSTSAGISESTEESVSGSAIRKGKETGEQSSVLSKTAGSKMKDELKAKKKKEEEDSSNVSALASGYEMDKRPLGEQIAVFAAFWKGVPYQKGGAMLPKVDSTGWIENGMEPDPEIWRADGRGVDSAGFVHAVFKHFKITLPPDCREQEKYGEYIRTKDIQAGDIIFYGVSSYDISHCGICLGDGRVVHCSPKEGRVIISDMNYRKIVSVRRVTKNESNVPK